MRTCLNGEGMSSEAELELFFSKRYGEDINNNVVMDHNHNITDKIGQSMFWLNKTKHMM